ncbi:mraW methylase family protein [Forsythia ovata]|uniref:MraW methylase family protein n=1 Tax=Forsythia ovata TaxID=205694 RepID=A0ABD1W493_9LAMI
MAYECPALKNKNKVTKIQKRKQKWNSEANLLLKRRTRSDKELDEEIFLKHYGNGDYVHVPVMLGEVLDVFASMRLDSFVDCTLGAGGHSSAIIQAHPEMKFYVGLDVDPVAHEMAQSQLKGVVHKDSCDKISDLQVHTLLKNFKNIKSVLHEIDGEILADGVHGILIDLGMSSMQVNNSERGFSVLNDGPLDMRMNPEASLRAEDILNSWPDSEVGRILRDYGEENNWYSLQNKIVKARLTGGLHSTRELVDLIRNSTSWTRGGRQGWIKTATRVFQALRIAVNDELNTLKDSIRACFDSLASGGRLAVISFHSLEDRIVKQAFLNIVNCSEDDFVKIDTSDSVKEGWIKQIVQGRDATILTKRPITPSEKEEKLNTRSRSAKLRVIQKI